MINNEYEYEGDYYYYYYVARHRLRLLLPIITGFICVMFFACVSVICQSYSGQYERFAPGYVQPDYALLIDAIISYFIIIGTLK